MTEPTQTPPAEAAPPAGETTPPAGNTMPAFPGEGSPPPAEETPPASGGEATPPAPADDEPPVRKTPTDFIIARKNAKIEKLEAERKQRLESAEISPEDEAKFDAWAEKNGLTATLAASAQATLTGEVQQFVSQNEAFKPYAAKIAKWAQSQAFASVPIEQVAYAAAGKDLLSLGAKLGADANREAANNSAAGAAAPTNAAVPDYSSMSQADFEARVAKTKQQV